MQQVASSVDVRLERADLRSGPADDIDAEIVRLAQKEGERPFDLQRGPLVRATLLQAGDADHVLLLTMHHIVSDAWSLGVLLREMTALYDARLRGGEAALPELGLQYADFARWQRRWLVGDKLSAQLAYWRLQLNGIATLELPTDRPRPAVQTFDGARHRFEIRAEVAEGLRALGRRSGATMAMVLLGAWQTLLARYSGQDDIAVGSPIANRTHGELESLIGFFTNTLVMRGDLSGDPSFTTLLERVRSASLAAYEHQDVPFEEVVAALNPERDRSRHPLFGVLFTMQNAPRESPRLGDVAVEAVRMPVTRTRFDLELHCGEVESCIRCQLVYNVDLFDASTIEGMATHLVRLLESVVAEPGTRVSEIELLTARERDQMLGQWNDTAKSYDSDVLAHELVEAQATRLPDSTAVTCGDARLTYRELNSRANQLAHTLRAAGVGPDARVAICVDRSIDMVVGTLAILKAGAGYVPVDPGYPSERLAFMLEDSAASVLLAQSGVADEIGESDILHLELDSARWKRAPSADLTRVSTPASLAYVIYTSGSTGRPKGVAMPHAPLVNLVQWQIETSRGDRNRALQFAPFSFDVSFQEMFATLGAGGTLHIVDEEARRDPHALLDVLRRHPVDRIFLPFVALAQLAEAAARVDALPEAPRAIITAGEQLQVTPAIRTLFERWAGCELHNHYGPAECHVVTAHVLSGPPASWPVLPPIGRPIANSRIYITGPSGVPVPVGIKGELCIGGAAVSRGYLGAPDLTADRFRPDPWQAGGRTYRTGDLARFRPDGVIEFHGRIDEQIKLRGFRIEPGEIEAVLEEHPAVDRAVAAVHEDANGRRLVAYLVPNASETVPVAEIMRLLRERLPGYMVPSALVSLASLPLTPSGKVDRRALPAPDPAVSAGVSSVGPRSGKEEVLCAIWCDVLGLAGIGVHDDFFECGGHSLLATQVMSRVRDAFATDLPLSALFEGPTIAQLEESIEIARPVEAMPPLVRVDRSGDQPVSFAQQRLWVLDRMGSALSTTFRSRFACPASWTMKRSSGRLRWSWIATKRCGPPSPESNGQPVQRVIDSGDFTVRRVELRDLPDAQRDAAVRRVAVEEAEQTFDLSRGPLLRATLLELGDEDHALLLTMHHIVSDGWSLSVLIGELSTLYGAFTGAGADQQQHQEDRHQRGASRFLRRRGPFLLHL